MIAKRKSIPLLNLAKYYLGKIMICMIRLI